MPNPPLKQKVIDALPGTMPGLVKRTGGMSEAGIRRWLRILRGEERAHIKRWNRTVSSFSPFWVLGAGKDAKLPQRHSQAVYSRRWRQKRDLEKIEIAAVREQARANADRVAQNRDPLVAALFGKPTIEKEARQ